MPEKGPPVFLDYDQAALDTAYDQAAYARNREQLIKRRIRTANWRANALASRNVSPTVPGEIERLGIYRRDRTPALVFIFVHGGAWRSGRSKDFGGPAQMFLAAGRTMSCPTSPGYRMSAAV
jgi:arylformamidase